jgi:hypothetical protein
MHSNVLCNGMIEIWLEIHFKSDPKMFTRNDKMHVWLTVNGGDTTRAICKIVQDK